MSIEKTCKNCEIEDGVCDYCYYCKNYNFGKNDFSEYKFIPKEELIREDERNRIYKLLSKVCLQDNVKYGFQLDGKDYLITRVGHIDTFEKMIRDEERNKIIELLEKGDY